jgi:hypothetical protein
MPGSGLRKTLRQPSLGHKNNVRNARGDEVDASVTWSLVGNAV